MFEIIKKTNRFTDDEPVVIAYADSLSEAEALAHDYQVNSHHSTAFVTIRRAGERISEGSVPDADFRISYQEMSIEGLDDQRFLVAKLRRICSPPVQQGSVSDLTASALGRLVDLFRLGRDSQNFADLTKIEWHLKEDFQTDAETEWAACTQAVCQALGVERLEPVPLLKGPQRLARYFGPNLHIEYHHAELNDRPYLVARVGQVFGSPAPIFLIQPHQRGSAYLRLRDQFRISEHGQCFKDLMEGGLKTGKTEQDIRSEWRGCELAVWSEKAGLP